MINLEILPELTLLRAVLERAMYDISLEGKLKEKAREWLCEWSNDDRQESFSLPWICEHLSVDPIRVKRAAMGIMKRQKKIRYSLKRQHVIGSEVLVDRMTATGNEIYFQ